MLIDRDYPNRPFAAALAICRRGERLLLAQRAKGPSTAIGRWGFPGGMHEVGETILAAAARELKKRPESMPSRSASSMPLMSSAGKPTDASARITSSFASCSTGRRARASRSKTPPPSAGTRPMRRFRSSKLLPDTLRLMKAALG